MAKFRKRPIIVEAVRYLGNGNMENREVPKWLWKAFEEEVAQSTNGTETFIIKTLEGEHIVSPGDYIIQGVKGELYPIKADIFEQTYEKVEE